MREKLMSVQVTLVGNATNDAEIAFTESGIARASFGIAVNERVKNEDGTWGDGDPVFYRVTAWRLLAESVAAEVSKGNRVIVVGKLKPREYEAKDGTTKMSLDVTADEVGASIKFSKPAGREQRQDAWADPVPF